MSALGPKLHDPTGARDRECPFKTAMVVQKHPATGEPTPSFVSGRCTDRCALYDREKGRPCIDRVLEALRPVMTMPTYGVSTLVRKADLPPLEEAPTT